MDTVNDILSVVGLISLALLVIRTVRMMLAPKTRWTDNVEIREYTGDDLPPDEETEGEVFRDGDDFATVNYVIPHGCIIRNLKIKQLREETIPKEKWKYKTVRLIPAIYPDRPLCMVISRGEAIARYMIEWSMEYGEKAQYYFYDNLRTGDNQAHGIVYSAGFWCRLRRLAGLD